MQNALLAQLASTPNRGDRHIFLGQPWGSTADKTTVEPGNGSSPGLWSCGISVWAWQGESWISPDCVDRVTIAAWDLQPPHVDSVWHGEGVHCSHRITHHAEPAQSGWDVHEIAMSGSATWCVVVRGIGPAGAPIQALSSDGNSVIVNGIRISGDGIISISVHDQIACLFGSEKISLHVAHRGGVTTVPSLPADTSAPARIWAPDARVAATWDRCAHHLLAAAEHGLPRIGVATYPGLWFRDGILIAHAWDLIGRHELARHACLSMAPIDFAGGFGAETDAPGEVAWLLAQHAQLTQDPAWLAQQRPHLERRAEWIQRMRRATVTLRAPAVDRMPRCLVHPDLDVVCHPAKNDCISSRMDWHAPDLYCNAWSIAGLRAAGVAAQADNDQQSAQKWADEANDLERALITHLLPAYGNPRDPVCSPWPTAAAATVITEPCAAWFLAHRWVGGERQAEPWWSYFEVAQIHNAQRCGLREPAWDCLSGLLNDGGDVAAYGEGRPSGEERLPWGPHDPHGWLRTERTTHGNMPHGWTCAEMIACLRDMFVVDALDHLRIGVGVPQSWLQPGMRWGVDRLPTRHGPVSFAVKVDRAGVAHLHETSATPLGVPLRLELPTS